MTLHLSDHSHAAHGQGGSLTTLIADDHALFRLGLRYLLEALPGATVIEVGSLQEALSRLRERHVDLVLLDLILPDAEPQQAVQPIVDLAAGTPVVVVSMIDEPDDIRRAIDAGAVGFIPKTSRPEIMLQAIKLVLSGGIYLPPALLRTARLEAPAPKPNGGTEPSVQITGRQTAVLRELASGKPNKQIAYALGLSEATVKVHVTAILKALKASNRTKAVLIATELGLLSDRPSNGPDRR